MFSLKHVLVRFHDGVLELSSKASCRNVYERFRCHHIHIPVIVWIRVPNLRHIDQFDPRVQHRHLFVKFLQLTVPVCDCHPRFVIRCILLPATLDGRELISGANSDKSDSMKMDRMKPNLFPQCLHFDKYLVQKLHERDSVLKSHKTSRNQMEIVISESNRVQCNQPHILWSRRITNAPH